MRRESYLGNDLLNRSFLLKCQHYAPPFLGYLLQQMLLHYGLSQHEFQAKMLVCLDHTSDANYQRLKY
jgi:hypothetical protein